MSYGTFDIEAPETRLVPYRQRLRFARSRYLPHIAYQLGGTALAAGIRKYYRDSWKSPSNYSRSRYVSDRNRVKSMPKRKRASTSTRGSVSRTKKYRKTSRSSKRRSRRRRRNKRSSCRALSRRVDDIAAKVNHKQSTYIYRYGIYNYVKAGAGTCTFFGSASSSRTTVRAAIDALPVWNVDPVGGGGPARQNINFTTQTFQSALKFDVFHTWVARNNSNRPVILHVVPCHPKDKTSDTVLTNWTEGLDHVGLAGKDTNTLTKLSDGYHGLHAQWSTGKIKKVRLEVGAELTLNHKMLGLSFNPASDADNTETYQKNLGSMAILGRVEGVMGHRASTPWTVGTGAGSIIYHHKTTIKVYYDSAQDSMKTIELVQTNDTNSKYVAVHNEPEVANVVGPGS